ncbi:MAG: hypothetical protein HUJ66_08950 [Oscillospiraceae bacterium]|nr:hypothetical protein [Oscillospiraceae bacterium]
MNNLFKAKIEKHEKPLGIFFDTASVSVMECIGRTGFDYVIIDNEHSPIEAESSADFIRAAENCGLTPLCRVRETSRPAILKLLDVGAQGLIVPNVHSVQQVRELVSYAKYHPVGERGFCPTRKDGWGYDIPGSVSEVMAHFNGQTLLIPQCETVGSLECIEEIAALEGVDGIFVGPFDLSISMGIPGDFGNPVFQAALDRILRACHEAGKFCMLFAPTADAVVSGFERGFDSMTYSLDASVIIDAMRTKVNAIKERL